MVSRKRSFVLAASLGGAALFAGSAGVVLWQNTRVGALQDLSYVLNNAYRIAAGDIPYRDFSQPHAPLTFLIQAAIVRLFDSSYRHHMAYAALLSGLATLVTWEIATYMLRGRLARPRLLAFAACLPLVPLGIHSLYPHPWYDADASFFSLLAVLAMLRAANPETGAAWPLLAGALAVLPVFAKQNVGLALFAGLQLTALSLAYRPETRGRYVRFALGSVLAALASLAVIAVTCGLGAYLTWTAAFAAERRLQPALLLDAWRDGRAWVWAASALAGAVLITFRRRWLAAGGGALLMLPLAWGLVADDGARVFFRLWPFTLLLASALALWSLLRGGAAFEAGLTLTLVLACEAAFLAQGVEGSNFALWPFFVILSASISAGLSSLRFEGALPVAECYLLLAAFAALVTGTPQLLANRRLAYVHGGGAPKTSRHPRLAGLHVPGPYLPPLDDLLDFLESCVPADEAIVEIHGEDPIHFALRRRPRLPLVIFDTTVNPYTPDQLVRLFLEREIAWVVVKKKRQIRHQPMAHLARVVSLLREHYVPVLENETYLVLRRSAAARGRISGRVATPDSSRSP